MNRFYKQLEMDALAWTREAAGILKNQEQSFSVVTKKDELDIATSADMAVEQFFAKKIHEKYPDHALYGEEFGLTDKTSQYVWILDPLDGTKEYTKGIGEYSILVAVEERGVLVAGVVKRFGHELEYTASKGNGAFLSGKKLAVSHVSTLDMAFIGTNLPNKKRSSNALIDSYVPIFIRLIKTAYRVRPGCDDAKMFAWVAQGAHDGCISLPKTNKWFDIAPALLLVEEAGGTVTDFSGDYIKNHDLSRGIIVSNGIIHEKLISIVKKII